MIDENNVENLGPNVRNSIRIQAQGVLLRLRSMLFGPVVISLLCCGLLAGEIQAKPAQKGQAPQALIQLNNSVEALVRKVSPSVVQVLVTGFKPLSEESHRESSLVFGKQLGVGSGAIVDSDGYIITNAHVVSNEHRVQVVLSSLGDEAPSTFSGSNLPWADP